MCSQGEKYLLRAYTFTNWFLTSFFKRQKNFVSVIKLFQESLIFLDEWKVGSVALQRVGVQPPYVLEYFYKHNGHDKDLKLYTYSHLDILKSLKQFQGISNIYDVSMTLMVSLL